MRRIIFGFAIGLLTFASSAWADGPIVRWDRVEGVVSVNGGGPYGKIVFGNPSFTSSGFVFTLSKGRATVNLGTGFVSFRVEGLGAEKILPNESPVLGAGWMGRLRGTLVCNASGTPKTTTWSDTPYVQPVNGDASFEGFIEIKPECLAYPADIAFLIREDAEAAPGFGDQFVAYGAGRVIN